MKQGWGLGGGAWIPDQALLDGDSPQECPSPAWLLTQGKEGRTTHELAAFVRSDPAPSPGLCCLCARLWLVVRNVHSEDQVFKLC